MGFQCCICHEDLSKKKPTEAQDASKQDPTVVTTKCGHLFHSECLSSWFEKKGKQAWTTRECPVCRMELTVATDVIRIFFPFNSPEEGLTAEDYKSHIYKLEKANEELAIRLEQTFLLGRDQEKKINGLTVDKERLQKAYILERSKAAQVAADCAKLKLDNEELKTVIIDLNIKAMSNGANGMNIVGMPHMMPPGGYLQPRFPEQMMVGPRPGNINLLQYNNYPHPPGMHAPGNMMGQMIDQGWSTRPVSQSNLAPGVEIGGNLSNRSNQKADSEALSSQLSNLLLHRETPNHSTSSEPKSFLNGNSNNNQSSLNSGPGTSLNEGGDIQFNMMDIRSIEPGLIPLKDSNLNTNNPRVSLSYASKMSVENGLGISNQSRTSTSDAPSDELMDEILRAEPKTVPPNDKQIQSVDNKIITLSNEIYRSKGKTKWKVMGYEEEKKLYGKFYCKTCGAKWGTSRHILNEPQTCQKCGESTFPYAQGPVMSKEELAMEKINRHRQT